MKRSPQRVRYPVISIVVSYLETQWTKNLTIRNSVVFPKDDGGNSLGEALPPFSTTINSIFSTFRVCPSKQYKLFRSDFKLIADAYYALANYGAPITDDVAVRIQHIEDSIRCVREMFNAEIAETVRKQIDENHGDVTMGVETYLVERLVNQGREHGRLQNAREASIRMWNIKTPVPQIAEIQGVSPELVQIWINEAQTTNR